MSDEQELPKVGERWLFRWDGLFGGVCKVRIVHVCSGGTYVVRLLGDLKEVNSKQLIAKCKPWWRFWK